MEEYRTKTAQDKTIISNTLKRLPSEVKYEDMILYTDAMAIESNVGLDESSIGFTDPMLFLEFNGVTAENVDNTSKAVPMKAYRSSFSIESGMNYQYVYRNYRHKPNKCDKLLIFFLYLPEGIDVYRRQCGKSD